MWSIIGFRGSKALGHIWFQILMKQPGKTNLSKITGSSLISTKYHMFTEKWDEIKVKYVKNGVYSVLNSYPCLVWWVCRQWDRWLQMQWLHLQLNQPQWRTSDKFETLSFQMDGLSLFRYSLSEVSCYHFHYGTFPFL